MSSYTPIASNQDQSKLPEAELIGYHQMKPPAQTSGNDFYVALPDNGNNIIRDAGGKDNLLLVTEDKFGLVRDHNDLDIMYGKLGQNGLRQDHLIIRDFYSSGMIENISIYQKGTGKVLFSGTGQALGNKAYVPTAEEQAKLDQIRRENVLSAAGGAAGAAGDLVNSVYSYGYNSVTTPENPNSYSYNNNLNYLQSYQPQWLNSSNNTVDPSNLYLAAWYYGTDQADVASTYGKGDNTAVYLNGLGGNDTLYGGGCETSILQGDKGDDVLVGGERNNCYLFTDGDGHDTVNAHGEENVAVILTSSQNPPQIQKNGNDLSVFYGNSLQDTILFHDYFGNGKVDDIIVGDARTGKVLTDLTPADTAVLVTAV